MKIEQMIAHVYFYAIPIGTEFTWKGERYKKIANENSNYNVLLLSESSKRTFEPHYGVVIEAKKALDLRISVSDYRPLEGSFEKIRVGRNGKLHRKPVTDERVQKLDKKSLKENEYIVSIGNVYHPHAVNCAGMAVEYLLSKITENEQ
jgi:hypothetical protein